MNIWAEGKFIDLWSLNHFLFGFITGFFFFQYFPIAESFLTAALLFTAWELFEVTVRAGEYWTNQVMDIIIGLIGLLFSYNVYVVLNMPVENIAPLTFVILFLFLEIWGYKTKFARRRIKNPLP
ncbi:MAG: hypothetical protein A3J48_04425 [Candidatus Doudnabacteria bacterium RIFCSPHIGHO2_02_FULL_46_11]|uniref:VanZ-like domain-containing protein n=1 Tax=Candidatus Doudnabacteria bacterium RIFCSPHIGHO2_02_FULL_46_11 TaxID=1817832 RepID=A0A1F5P561_9BACT|nr:MAG: hypothetical protein A3J48_04425 [Candidatus Doudnabacteria bacterium RIFCSPHIGHO2_02_FULL_46_11]